MHSWGDPGKWDLWQKIAGFIASVFAATLSVFGLPLAWRKLLDELDARRLARERKERERITAIVSEVLAATHQQSEALYQQGRAHEQEGFLGLMEGVQRLDSWTSVHQLSDDGQFQDLKHEVDELRGGQRHTHEELKQMRAESREMRDTVIRVDEGIQWLREERSGGQERRRRP